MHTIYDEMSISSHIFLHTALAYVFAITPKRRDVRRRNFTRRPVSYVCRTQARFDVNERCLSWYSSTSRLLNNRRLPSYLS